MGNKASASKDIQFQSHTSDEDALWGDSPAQIQERGCEEEGLGERDGVMLLMNAQPPGES